MTAQQAIDSLVITVDRPDLATSYLDFLNRAIHETAVRYNFAQLKKTDQVVINIGGNSAELPSDFKAWQDGRFCASIAIGAGASAPVPVYIKAEIEKLSPLFRPALHLVYTQDDGGYQVVLPAPAAATNTIRIFYFGIPEAITDLALSTPLLDYYPNMVMSKTRSLIFQSINDPIYQTHEMQFEKELSIVTGVALRSAFVKSTMPQPDPQGEQPS